MLGGHGGSISGTEAVVLWERCTPVLKLPGIQGIPILQLDVQRLIYSGLLDPKSAF